MWKEFLLCGIKSILEHVTWWCYRKCCIVKVIVTNCCVDLHVIASYPIPCSPFHLILTPSELKLLLKPYYGPLVLLCCWSGGSSEGCLPERGREPSLHCCPFLTPVSRIPEKHTIWTVERNKINYFPFLAKLQLNLYFPDPSLLFPWGSEDMWKWQSVSWRQIQTGVRSGPLGRLLMIHSVSAECS